MDEGQGLGSEQEDEWGHDNGAHFAKHCPRCVLLAFPFSYFPFGPVELGNRRGLVYIESTPS